ncbi:hypothetical protein, partial [Kingella kingae]
MPSLDDLCLNLLDAVGHGFVGLDMQWH